MDKNKRSHIYFFYIFLLVFLVTPSYAQETVDPVELNGDQIEFEVEENKMIVQGNVSVIKDNAALFADQMDFYRDTSDAYVTGDVLLEFEDESYVRAQDGEYNFDTQKGEFRDAYIYSYPYFGYGKRVQKVGENHFIVHDGYFTTSDLDDPGYRVKMKTLDLYPKDKAIARRATTFIGTTPVMYLPKYTQPLGVRRGITIKPGYKKEYGAYALIGWRHDWSQSLETTVHMDYRERLDFASGVDAKYRTDAYGDGTIRTYYTNQRFLGRSHLYSKADLPTIERERYRAEWRHKWDYDRFTQINWQYSNLSDATLLEDFFEREDREDSNPSTFFTLTRALPPYSTLTLRVDKRINRFTSQVERFPELQYGMSNRPLGETGFYGKTTNTVGKYVQKSASPSDVKNRSFRFDTDNEISYPFKVAFIELRPFLGNQFTFYTNARDVQDDNKVRGVLRTGIESSTKFSRVFDVFANFYGIEINRLRHIIRPSINYRFRHDPTITNDKLFQFDGIDAVSKEHGFTLGLENKLQTKREGKLVDLARLLIETPFPMKDDPRNGSFGAFDFDLDLNPVDWLSFYADVVWDPHVEKYTAADLEIQLHDKELERWEIGIQKRYARDADDILNIYFDYQMNSKWRFENMARLDVNSGDWRDEKITVIRDLHSWEMEILVDYGRRRGTDFMLAFTLKAFPDLGLSGGSSFNAKKPGDLAR